jgi:hypothetical protein
VKPTENCDGESTFSVSLVKDSRQKIGWVPKISFKIGLNPRDKILLERIMAFGTPADDWSNAFLIFLRPEQ